MDRIPDYLSELRRGQLHKLVVPIGSHEENNDGSLMVDAVVGASPGPTLTVFGGVHGYEYEGPFAIHNLARTLDPQRLHGQVVFLAAANPGAVTCGERCDARDGLDLNRVFPGDANGSYTHRLAALLFNRFVLGSDLVISFHSWPPHGNAAPFVDILGSGGEPKVMEQSLACAQAFGCRHIRRCADQSGLLLTEAVKAGVAAIEPEYGGLGTVARNFLPLPEDGVRRVMAHLGMIEGFDPTHAAAVVCDPCTVTAPASGLLQHEVTLGTSVVKGQPIATIVNLRGEVTDRLIAPSDGVIVHLRSVPSIAAGESAATLLSPI